MEEYNIITKDRTNIIMLIILWYTYCAHARGSITPKYMVYQQIVYFRILTLCEGVSLIVGLLLLIQLHFFIYYDGPIMNTWLTLDMFELIVLCIM